MDLLWVLLLLRAEVLRQDHSAVEAIVEAAAAAVADVVKR